MKNSLIDLNNHLFEQMEKLNDDSVTGKELQEEVIRAEAMSKISREVVKIADTVLQVAKLKYKDPGAEVPEFLLGKKQKNILEIE